VSPASSGVVTTTRVVDRAGGSANDVYVCMRYAAGAVYANKPLFLYRWNGSQWVHIRSGSTNSSGCGTWVDVGSNAYYLSQGYWTYRVGCAIYYLNGYSGYAWVGPAANRTVRLGNGSVGGAYYLGGC
jgi:hypothetical protein